MCKYCEQNERKLFKPMAVNDVGFKIPLVGIAFREDTDDKVLQVNFDESEPLRNGLRFGKKFKPCVKPMPIGLYERP